MLGKVGAIVYEGVAIRSLRLVMHGVAGVMVRQQRAARKWPFMRPSRQRLADNVDTAGSGCDPIEAGDGVSVLSSGGVCALRNVGIVIDMGRELLPCDIAKGAGVVVGHVRS